MSVSVCVQYLSSPNIASNKRCLKTPELGRVQTLSLDQVHTHQLPPWAPRTFYLPFSLFKLIFPPQEGSFIWLVKIVFNSLSMHCKSFTVKCQPEFQIGKLNICF